MFEQIPPMNVHLLKVIRRFWENSEKQNLVQPWMGVVTGSQGRLPRGGST